MRLPPLESRILKKDLKMSPVPSTTQMTGDCLSSLRLISCSGRDIMSVFGYLY